MQTTALMLSCILFLCATAVPTRGFRHHSTIRRPGTSPARGRRSSPAAPAHPKPESLPSLSPPELADAHRAASGLHV